MSVFIAFFNSSVDPDGSVEKIFEDIGCSNGLGWSPDHKTMCTSTPVSRLRIDYIDSNVDEIRAFDYDVATGKLTNKRIFAHSPEGAKGCFDGMTIDGVGNVWSARWTDSRVMGFRPDGSLIVNIATPGCLMPTIPCFGGEYRMGPTTHCRAQPRDHVHCQREYKMGSTRRYPSSISIFW